MPVKIEHSSCRFSPTPFECTSMLLNDFDEQFTTDIHSSSPSTFDEIWNTFIPTPPQSPPMKIDFPEFQDEDFFEDSTDEFDPVIHHDCMWSGQCSEGMCNSMYNKPVMRSRIRPDTPFNLSTSPLSTLNYISSYDANESLNSFMDEELQETKSSSDGVEGNIFAMANDHSYEGSNHKVKVEKERKEKSKFQLASVAIWADTNSMLTFLPTRE